MDYQHLIVSVAGGVARVRMNRPERLNALNPRLAEELRDFFASLNARSAARVGILEGAGPAFCAGADLTDLQPEGARKNVGDMFVQQHRTRDIMLAMRRCPQPIISIVQGAASGGGFA